ncbi:DUF2913 family protein [Vibrio marisflavi]|uniref:Alpha-acetolactate decarboxylase n=1 Tax=Vibrio marisflavi CECT 7928 TaxID=634439 RepID=A0ABN8E5T9_9VIBR|nr:DUF2913 family protein [Vibrio marisflavi]CAH0540255.1 hypothetical protein VMF7928_02700 [Vibrio marisflavi CECT 7928]
MAEYIFEIKELVNTALSELSEQHKSGKLVDAPVANNHFLVRWITKSLKTQRFSRSVFDDLSRWQKMGRSKGNDAAINFTFRKISQLYGEFFPQNEVKDVLDSQVESFLDAMETLDWEVSTSEPLTLGGKVQLFTESQNSLALCSEQCDSCFDAETLVKPMSWFVRGNHQEFIEKAYQAGFLVHKVTDYKSAVKYHGEYLVFPANKGDRLAEIPFSIEC